MGVINFVNGADIGMIKSRGRLGFALETAEGLPILGYLVGQEFQRYKAAELHILRFVNHAHTTGAEFFDDAVMRNGLANEWRRIRHRRDILGCSRKQVNEPGGSDPGGWRPSAPLGFCLWPD